MSSSKHKAKMSLYLHDIPLFQAKKYLEDALVEAGLWDVLGTEIIPLNEFASDRILAKPLHAKISNPSYNSAAMDGFAVKVDETCGATPANPITLKIGFQAVYVDTGDLVPDGFNSVVPIEDVETLDEKGIITRDRKSICHVRLRASLVPWNNVRSMGEDITETQLVLVGGSEIRPIDLGVIASAGFSEIEVARKPRVAILPTGSELVPVGTALQPGFILEFNSLVIAGKVNEWGCVATRFPIIQDDFESILKNVIYAAEEHDLVLLNAGSSAGSEDFSASVIEKTGRLLVHGVAIRPGHPVIIGIINSGKRLVPIIGVPGFPVSAALTLDIFVKNIIDKWLGRISSEGDFLIAKLIRKITSPAGDEEYLRVAIAKIADSFLAAPLTRKAGSIASFARADGILKIPSGVQGIESGELVKITLLRKKAEIERTILCVGSHDLILDEMTHLLTEKQRRFVSVNIGSQGGLIALGRGESHLAGSHLLDPETGEYNVKYIHQYVGNVPVKVITLANREQGLLIRRNNPKNIESLNDLVRNDILFINRQRGSGTRVLLDYNLKLNSINADVISGYGLEEYTHYGVAAAVASGRADCGLGLAAASLIYNLDFIPLFKERYDLIISKRHAESELLAPLFDILWDLDFKNSILKMKGYDVELMGKVVWES
jgi:putative molybdopterin biosynthesis protein